MTENRIQDGQGSSARPRKNRWERVLAFGFPALLVGIGLVSVLTPQKGFSESENRYLQKRPEFTWSTLLDGSFGTAYEAYLSDQFPGREGWVAAKTQAERLSGSRDVNGVYFGKDGYLIEKFDAEDIEGEQLEKNLDVLSGVLKRMESRYGSEHVRVMLAPGASQILTDKLPSLAAPYDQDRVVEKLAERLGGDGLIVPVAQALSQAHESTQEPLYYRTDHHWTAAGAFAGYEAWARSAGIRPWEEDQFDQVTVSDDFRGTLYSKVQTGETADPIVLYLPREPVSYRVEYDMSGEMEDGLYAYDALETRDQYAVFLDGNHGLTRIAGGAENGKKLLLIKDSYAHSMAPFLANHFEEILMVDLRYFNADPEQFAEENGVTDILVLYRAAGFASEKTVSKLR